MTSSLQLLVAFVALLGQANPYLTATLKQSRWRTASPTAAAILNVALAVLTTLVVCLSTGSFTAVRFGLLLITNYGSSVVGFHGFAKPTGLVDLVEAATNLPVKPLPTTTTITVPVAGVVQIVDGKIVNAPAIAAHVVADVAAASGEPLPPYVPPGSELAAA